MSSKAKPIEHGIEKPAMRFLRSAKQCRIRDLTQLLSLSELVTDISALIHSLQKERGTSSIFLGSNGAQFADRLLRRIQVCKQLEDAVRQRLEHIDERLDRMSSGAKFYTRVAYAFHALDSLAATREQIAALKLAPQDSVKAFTEIIGALLAVVFEAADIAADPNVSRALIALVNFSQGKEYAGQERATAGAGFSRGHFNSVEHQRLYSLVAAQEQAFRIFSEFAGAEQVEAFRNMVPSRIMAEVERLRHIALTSDHFTELPDIAAESWFEHTTRRIDAMKKLEDCLNKDLNKLCADKLAEAQAESDAVNVPPQENAAAGPLAMLVMDASPSSSEGLDGGVGLYTLEGMNPKPMRSILDVMQAQSQRLHDVSHELESTRSALNERKVIERAKGLLMKSRRMTEQEAYALMRQTAMNQHKRIVEVAEAIIGMADIL